MHNYANVTAAADDDDDDDDDDDGVERVDRTVKIESSTVEIEERGVKLRLTVVDTPGYSDAVNSNDW